MYNLNSDPVTRIVGFLLIKIMGLKFDDSDYLYHMSEEDLYTLKCMIFGPFENRWRGKDGLIYNSTNDIFNELGGRYIRYVIDHNTVVILKRHFDKVYNDRIISEVNHKMSNRLYYVRESSMNHEDDEKYEIIQSVL